MLRTARIIPISISHAASGPEPKTIGNGPINITTPVLVDALEAKEATVKTAMPIKTKATPKIKSQKSLLETGMPSSSGSFSPLRFFHLTSQ